MNITSTLTPQFLEKNNFTVLINKEWQIPKGRHQVKSLAMALGYNINSTAELVTSMSELCYNLFFHANNGGEITVSVIESFNKTGIRLVSSDKGPGIACIANALQDGYSTNGGLGGGLPGTKRLMDEFSIASTSHGTLITCVKWQS